MIREDCYPGMVRPLALYKLEAHGFAVATINLRMEMALILTKDGLTREMLRLLTRLAT